MLGQVTADLINAFNPEMILIGGGMIVAEDIIMPELKEAAASGAISGAYENCRIETSSLGNDAGLTGAAGLVIKAMEEPR
jgi:glucokinase